MPNDFTQGQNANNQKSMSLNLDALGDAANQTVNMGSGEKPILKEEVEAEIIGTDFRLMNQLQSNQSDPSKKYFNTIFAIETKFSYKNEDGDMVEATSRDNYGGLRYFPKLDDNGQPIRDASGQPQLDRLWSGDGSAFGRLFLVVQEKDKTVRSYSDFFKFFAKEGIRCMIKTEETNYQGNKNNKEVIQSFL
ncbi:MAG: hypothetical protein IKT40_01985 [Bacilli bacterium]|nr:hypothetical protein [Bacilli bacterium]